MTKQATIGHIQLRRFDKALGDIRAIGWQQDNLINHRQHAEIIVNRHLGQLSIVSQVGFIDQAATSGGNNIKKADKSGAELAIIVGQEELANNTATIKHLRKNIEQESLTIDNVPVYLSQIFYPENLYCRVFFPVHRLLPDFLEYEILCPNYQNKLHHLLSFSL